MNTPQPIQKINRETVTDQMFTELRRRISDREWLPGDKLPSEAELAKLFGVSRMSARMALQKLAAIGFVETVNGGGTYVKNFEFTEIIGSIGGVLSHSISFDDMNRFRAVIEEATLELLRGRELKAEDLSYMEARLVEMEAACKPFDAKAFSEADFNFHLRLCAMSENQMFVCAYELCNTLFKSYFKSQYSVTKYRMLTGRDGNTSAIDALVTHRGMLESLRAGNIDACIAQLREYTGIDAKKSK